VRSPPLFLRLQPELDETPEESRLKPERLAADTAYGAAPMLNWLVEEIGTAPRRPLRPHASPSKRRGESICQSAPDADFDEWRQDAAWHAAKYARWGRKGERRI
jgi:hypothetical protein